MNVFNVIWYVKRLRACAYCANNVAMVQACAISPREGIALVRDVMYILWVVNHSTIVKKNQAVVNKWDLNISSYADMLVPSATGTAI